MADAIKQDGSGDYTSIQAWADAVAAGTATDGIGEIQDSEAYDEDVSISGNGGSYAEVRLTVAEANRHDGTAGSGARIVRTGADASIILATSVESDIEWIEVDGADQGAEKAVDLGGVGSIRNSIIHGIRFTGGASATGIGTTAAGTNRVERCIVYQIDRPLSNRGAVGITDGGAAARARHFYGNTVDNIIHAGGSADGFSSNNDETNRHFKNNVATRTDIDFDLAGTTNIDASNNASEDATAPGANSVTGITPADQFSDLTGGSEDYHLKSGADCIDAGVDLGTTANIDIDGRDVDAEGDTWDIGADEFVDEGGASVGQSAPDALTLSELTAGVSLATDVGAAVDSLTLTENQADVSLGKSIAAALDALTLSELGAAISLDVDIGAGVDTLTLSELAASVALGKSVSASVDVLTLSELAAGLALDVDVSAAVDSLSLTELAASISLGKSIQAAVDELGLTAHSADVALDVPIDAAVDSFTLTELTATVSLDVAGQIDAGTHILTLTEMQATIEGVSGRKGVRGMVLRVGRMMG